MVGSISGSGLDRARITWPSLTHSGLIRFLTPLVAITKSARAISSSIATALPPSFSSRCRASALRSVPRTSQLPWAFNKLTMPMPAAPRPICPMTAPGKVLPTLFAALISAASATTAVPCWSSCRTGISSLFFNCCSISKHSGALISSSCMAPNDALWPRSYRRFSAGPCCPAISAPPIIPPIPRTRRPCPP